MQYNSNIIISTLYLHTYQNSTMLEFFNVNADMCDILSKIGKNCIYLKYGDFSHTLW